MNPVGAKIAFTENFINKGRMEKLKIMSGIANLQIKVNHLKTHRFFSANPNGRRQREREGSAVDHRVLS